MGNPIPPHLAQLFPPHTLAAVGGAVRNHLLGQRPPPDIDLATTLPPDEAQALLQSAGYMVDATHARYGTLKIGEIELTSTRRESYASGSRFPQATFGASWEEDASRRDVTLNAIYLFPDDTRYDPFGGESDLKSGIVRFIGNPAQRLDEDPLRLYRFARFCGQYGLAGWSDDVHTALQAAVPAAMSLSKARVKTELAKLATTPHANQVQARLRALGLSA